MTLRVLGIGKGDEVIVPAYTYIATAIAVLAVGAIPIIADIDETLTLSPKDFERKITERTKAVIPVHIVGFPCNMDEIMRIAKEHNIMVLEDSCQSDGGSYKGKRLGSIGDAGALSFNYFKIITAVLYRLINTKCYIGEKLIGEADKHIISDFKCRL